MIQHIITERIITENISFVILLIQSPVVPEPLGADHQHFVVDQLIIFDDRQSFKSFSQTDTISNDTAIVFFQFLNCTQHAIFLEFVKFLPDQMFFNAGLGLNDFFFVQLADRVSKNVVQNQVVYEIRGFVTADPCKLL